MAQPLGQHCGHDVHVTFLLGASALLADSPHGWQGTVVAVFQPAEELGDGAWTMVDDGLAQVVGHVDGAFAQHVLSFASGVVGTRPQWALSAANSVRITVHGRHAHGSTPRARVDPVVLAEMIVVRLQTVIAQGRSDRSGPVDRPQLQVGTRSNVIEDHAMLHLNVPSYHNQTGGTILDAIRRICCSSVRVSASSV